MFIHEVNLINVSKKGGIMKKVIFLSIIIIFVTGFAFNAHAGLNDFLDNMNEKAIHDIRHFNENLSQHFGLPVPRVEDILRAVINPADAFMCMQLSLMTGKTPETVIKSYRQNKKKGWGNIAKQLGIKPGSDEFHALKQGDFDFDYNMPEKTNKKGKNKGKSKGKGKGKKK